MSDGQRELCLCPAASEYDPPCPVHGIRPIGMRGDGSYVLGEYEEEPKSPGGMPAGHAPVHVDMGIDEILRVMHNDIE